MDPVSVIVSAIALGAAAGLKDSATAVVKDAYAGLRRLLGARYGDVDVGSVERRPDSEAKRESLGEDLSDAGAATDAELLDAAQLVIAAVREAEPDVGGAVGIDLARVEAAALRIGDVQASGTGVRVRDGRFSGDITIGSVRAGQDPPPVP